MTRQPREIFQLKVTLDGIRPPIWRRFLVPDSVRLDGLHHILQVVMGWDDYHLHVFTIEDVHYAHPDQDLVDNWDVYDETQVALREVVGGEKARFRYEYDLGDSWHHTIQVEKVLPELSGQQYPFCLKGKRACPPEDIGGIWGYDYFLEMRDDPDHPDRGDYGEEFLEGFDPEAFDLDGINSRLAGLDARARGGRPDFWEVDESVLPDGLFTPSAARRRRLSAQLRAKLDDVPLRRDVVTLVSYVRDNKVVGTQSTGNLPLKAIEAITARFVDPIPMAEHVGELVVRVRSEMDVPALYFRHLLAVGAGLIRGGRARQWKLAPLGEQFLAAPSPDQVMHLLDTWWSRIRWNALDQYGYESWQVGHIEAETYGKLKAIPVDTSLSIDSFVEELVESAGLLSPAEDELGRFILQMNVDAAVIRPLADFGVLDLKVGKKEILGHEAKEIVSFRVTSLGRWLLETLADRGE